MITWKQDKFICHVFYAGGTGNNNIYIFTPIYLELKKTFAEYPYASCLTKKTHL
jgi:hypothetical protein